MSENDWEDQVDEESLARRAEPLKFFCEVLGLLRNTGAETFLKIFRVKKTGNRGEAEDMLYCFEQVAAKPPADLAELLFQHAGFKLFHMEPSKVTPYTCDEVLAWLRELVAKMRSIFDE